MISHLRGISSRQRQNAALKLIKLTQTQILSRLRINTLA